MADQSDTTDGDASVLGTAEGVDDSTTKPDADAKPDANADANADAKGDGSADADDKGGDDKAKVGAPEKYASFEMPEGFTATDAELGAFADLARGLNLTQEQAQQVVAFEGERMAQFAAAQEKDWQTQNEQWVEQIKKDPELGAAEDGDMRLVLAKRAVARIGGQALRDALNKTGVGNHPELIRAFYRVGKTMADDKIGEGGEVKPGTTISDKTPAQRLYGTQPN